jgi:hypothetical protein
LTPIYRIPTTFYDADKHALIDGGGVHHRLRLECRVEPSEWADARAVRSDDESSSYACELQPRALSTSQLRSVAPVDQIELIATVADAAGRHKATTRVSLPFIGLCFVVFRSDVVNHHYKYSVICYY